MLGLHAGHLSFKSHYQYTFIIKSQLDNTNLPYSSEEEPKHHEGDIIRREGYGQPHNYHGVLTA